MGSKKSRRSVCKKDVAPIENASSSERGLQIARNDQVLGRHIYVLPEILPHMDCRRLEIREAKHTIERDRIVWIVSEQDMGGDDFLAVLLQSLEEEKQKIYQLDLELFEGLVDDLHSLEKIIIGGNINRLCEELLASGKGYLLLDNVQLAAGNENLRRAASEVEELAQIFLDYCPELRVIVRSLFSFKVGGVNPVILNALDEPECKSYLQLHPNGKNAKKQDIDSGAIHSHTSGWPGRIDSLLNSLSANDFENIAHGSSDESIDERATLPVALIDIIEKWRNGEEYERRKYNLLVALTFFKFGESVNTIKYFGGRQRLRPSMADDLVNAGIAVLAETYELAMKPGEQDRFVLIKPAVQQYIHKSLGETLLKQCYEDAAEVYFGRDWRVGSYKLNSAFRFSSHRIHSIIEQNADLIITRLISDSLDAEESELKSKNVLDRVHVFQYYILRLSDGDKYLYIVRLCAALLPKLSDYDGHNLIKDIRFQYARSLRMLGEHRASIRECELLLQQNNPLIIVASLQVNLAYAYESLGELDEAKKIAEGIKTLKAKGDSVYHAKSILLGLSEDSGKYQKLDRLASKARQEGYTVSSNNMKMEVISELNDPAMQMAEYKKLAERARLDKDAYNMRGALISWMEIAVEHELPISTSEVDSLVEAYKYACSQRQRGMFYQSHAVLWGLLEKAGQIEVLLQLFRHSSTLQRLTGSVEIELGYLRKLVGLVRDIGLQQVAHSCDPSTLRYFAARANSHNLLSSSQLQLIR